jgi:DeoR family galactitol utilization operon repressor
LTIIGGQFRPSTESAVGPSALRELDRFHVSKSFVGTDGFSTGNGMTTHLVEGAEIVKKMSDQAEETILVADSSKYGKSGFVKVLPLSAVEKIISDAGLSAGERNEIEGTGIDLLLV